MKTGLILASFCVLAGTAFAQEKPRTASYVYGDGEIAFVLSEGQSTILEQGATGKNVSVAKQLGARGDVIYKDENGHIFVRLSISGAAIYYPQDDSRGLPVSRGITPSPSADLTSVEDWGAAYQYKGAKTARAGNRPTQRRQEPSN